MAFSMHGPSIRKYVKLHKNEVCFTACCDIDNEKAKRFAAEFNIPNHYTDIETMLDAEKPDAVSLICPVELTAELSALILRKGYPLIVEKPPGMITEETKQMMEAAGDVPNQVAFNRRYMPIVQKAKEMIGANTRINDIRYRMARVNRLDPDFTTTAIHGIDLVKYMAGNEYRQLHFYYREVGTATHYHISGQTENGTVVHLDFLPVAGEDTERLEISTSKGMFYLRLPIWTNCYDKLGGLEHMMNNQSVYTFSEEEESFVLSGFYHENAFFFDDLRKNKKPEGDIASGLQSVEVAEYIRRREMIYKK
jgi:predicted dehydrogenase